MSLTYKQVYDALPKDSFDKIVEMKREKTRHGKVFAEFSELFARNNAEYCVEPKTYHWYVKCMQTFQKYRLNDISTNHSTKHHRFFEKAANKFKTVVEHDTEYCLEKLFESPGYFKCDRCPIKFYRYFFLCEHQFQAHGCVSVWRNGDIVRCNRCTCPALPPTPARRLYPRYSVQPGVRE
jgi:hypothetical protein